MEFPKFNIRFPLADRDRQYADHRAKYSWNLSTKITVREKRRPGSDPQK
jgi:hypothetical protein